jgi:hypothetical protein
MGITLKLDKSAANRNTPPSPHQNPHRRLSTKWLHRNLPSGDHRVNAQLEKRSCRLSIQRPREAAATCSTRRPHNGNFHPSLHPVPRLSLKYHPDNPN